MSASADHRSYDVAAFQLLAYEFPGDKIENTNRKIKSLLRRHGLGTYQQERIDELRKLKDHLQGEIGKGSRSTFFKVRTGEFADAKDFDIDRLMKEASTMCPRVGSRDLYEIVWFAIYVNYLR